MPVHVNGRPLEPLAVGMPAHHPAWPVKCSWCGQPADGFNVIIHLGKKIDPKDGKLKKMAWGMSGTACIKCNTIIMPLDFSDAPEGVDRTYVDKLLTTSPWFCNRVERIQWLEPDKYEQKCKLPPEGEEDA